MCTSGRPDEYQDGCVSQGESMDELLANMREAIQVWLDAAPPDDAQPAEPRQVVELSV
jgi:predicted RNase H-like HicB family nuclease